MTFTTDELQRFWTAGGWAYQLDKGYWRGPDGDGKELPDSDDLQACFDVLERVCAERKLNTRFWYRPFRHSGPLHQVDLYASSEHSDGKLRGSMLETGEGATKQEAIIRAVLSLHRERRTK